MATKRKTDDQAAGENDPHAPLTDEQKQEAAFAALKEPASTQELRAVLAPSGKLAVIARKTPNDDWIQVAAIVGGENAAEFIRQHWKDEKVFKLGKPPEEWGTDAPLNLPRV